METLLAQECEAAREAGSDVALGVRAELLCRGVAFVRNGVNDDAPSFPHFSRYWQICPRVSGKALWQDCGAMILMLPLC